MLSPWTSIKLYRIIELSLKPTDKYSFEIPSAWKLFFQKISRTHEYWEPLVCIITKFLDGPYDSMGHTMFLVFL